MFTTTNSINVTVPAVLFLQSAAASYADKLNDPQRKPVKSKGHHYKSSVIKSDCFAKMSECVAKYGVYSAIFQPDADGLISSSRNTSYDLQ